MKRILRWIAGGVAALALLSACAFNVIRVAQVPTQLEASAQGKGAFKLDKAVTVSLNTFFSRTLREGTRWYYVGTTPEGDVFRTNDQVLTVEASHVHEAYIVVQGTMLKGFYLPVEKTHSPLSAPVELSMTPLTNP